MTSRAFAALAMATILAGRGSFAQTPQSAPAFEVASVKLHKADDNRRSMPQFLPGGRFVSTGIPLRFLIAIAYNVGFQSVRLSGAQVGSIRSMVFMTSKQLRRRVRFPDELASNARSEKLRLMPQTLPGPDWKLSGVFTPGVSKLL